MVVCPLLILEYSFDEYLQTVPWHILEHVWMIARALGLSEVLTWSELIRNERILPCFLFSYLKCEQERDSHVILKRSKYASIQL